MESGAIAKKVVTDVIVIAAVALPLLGFRLFVNPSTRGFFCNDETIRYPYHDSTVSNIALYIVGFGLPVAVMVVTEFAISKLSSDSSTPIYLFGVRIPVLVARVYEVVGVFCFGAACSQMMTDIGKYSIGRLRPHFYEVCNPSINCLSEENKYRYITDYTCLGTNLKRLKDARLSFPSGHSSFSAYTMVYLALYIQARINWKGSYLLKHAAQLCCILICWSTALSRITDNKHHWSDVTIGLIIGTTVAIITATFVSNLFGKKNDSLSAKNSSSNHSMVDDRTRPSIEI